jgi:hypothetical protein
VIYEGDRNAPRQKAGAVLGKEKILQYGDHKAAGRTPQGFLPPYPENTFQQWAVSGLCQSFFLFQQRCSGAWLAARLPAGQGPQHFVHAPGIERKILAGLQAPQDLQ